MAQKDAPEGSAQRRHIDAAISAGMRAKSLVERILAFSRSGLGERAPINVQAAIAETLDLLAASLPGRVQLIRKLQAGDAAVIGDAIQLHQVTMNLCTNAVQAMPAGGTLEVALDRVEVHERRALLHGEVAPGAYVRLAVRDTGTGIASEVLDRMFDPFFTTKGVGAGTGLGLSLVHGIVTDVGGAIDVGTVQDEGPTFTIWLPVAGTAPAPKAEVDAEEMLAQLGYEPVGFGASQDALKAFMDDPQRYDVVLTDEMMPQLTGSALASEIRHIRSDIPIIVMSGYVDSGFAALARSAGVTDVLRKPLKSGDIADAVARALAASSAATSASP
jgi:CheY-like chemotaxis protein